MSEERVGARYQHKVIGYVQAPPSCLSLAMNYEIPIPWKHILEHWEYSLLKDYLCSSTRFRVTSFSFEHMIHHHEPFMWMVCCHESGEDDSLQTRARRAVILNLVKELVHGCDYNVLFPFYRPYVNKRLSFRFLYEGSVVFRNIHLIFLRFNYWGDVARVRRLGFENAVFCVGFTGVYLVILCHQCSDLKRRSAKACAERTRSKLLHAAFACNTMILGPSAYELQKQQEIKRLTPQPCVCL